MKHGENQIVSIDVHKRDEVIVDGDHLVTFDFDRESVQFVLIMLTLSSKNEFK